MQNAITDHFSGPSLLRLPIAVKRFLHARAAVRSVCTFKATAQTCVPMGAVTIAITRHLVNDRRSQCSSSVGCRLRRGNHAGSGEILLRQDGRKFGGRRRTGRMERWNCRFLVQELRMCHASGKQNSEHTQKMLHILPILPQNRDTRNGNQPGCKSTYNRSGELS